MYRVLALLLMVGCASIVDPQRDWRRMPGIIEIGGQHTAPIQTPDTARRGVPFAATVTTWGSSSCTRPDGAEVLVTDLTANVTPYDLVATSGVCTDDLRVFPREVTLRFDETGEALIRVHGRNVLPGRPGSSYETRIVIEP